ncbi:MAG: DUF58 domain-containing protein, partial [Candidatus Omnitrophica bacterium]|nr:DUF58 domain-containing protein [Candidatus Omnitrophota bacterium]
KKIRRIQITTSRMVTDVFCGQYQSVFKGQGMEFDEVRQYQPGDEIRSIDWNVTARMGHPFVKKFVEERELTVMVLLDISKSSCFGTVNKSKNEIAAEICSVLALSAIKNNDKVGFLAFTDRVEKFIPPRKGLPHVLRVIREALYFKPQGRGTNISGALEYLNKVINHRTVVFIISDFYDTGFEKPLKIANKRHDCIAITLTDPKEINIPDIGIVQFKDPETQRTFLVDTSNPKVRKEFRINSLKKNNERKKMLYSLNVDSIDIMTDTSYHKSLFKFFKMREKRAVKR